MNFPYKINQDEAEIAGRMVILLDSVYRFGNRPEVKEKQSVGKHIEEIVSYVNELPADDELKETLRMMALFHDMGEIFGELPLGHKKLERKIANYGFYLAAKYNARRFVEEVNTLRRTRKQIESTGDDPNDLITYFETRDEDVTNNLFDIYCFSTDRDQDIQKLFSIIDKLDGSRTYFNLVDGVPKSERTVDPVYYNTFYENSIVYLRTSEWATKYPDMVDRIVEDLEKCQKQL